MRKNEPYWIFGSSPERLPDYFKRSPADDGIYPPKHLRLLLRWAVVPMRQRRGADGIQRDRHPRIMGSRWNYRCECYHYVCVLKCRIFIQWISSLNVVVGPP